MLRNLKLCLTVIACLLSNPIITNSQSNNWESIGPLGVSYNAILKSDQHSGNLYILGRGTLFKSSDKGMSWNNVFPLDLHESRFSDLIIAERNSDELYLIDGGQGVIYVSMNACVSWEIYYSDNSRQVIFLDKNNPLVCIALKQSGGWRNYSRTIEKSIDAGLTWNEITNGIDVSVGPLSAWINSNNPNYIIAQQLITHGGDEIEGWNYYRSTNYGIDWKKFQLHDSFEIKEVVFDPINELIYYVKDLFGQPWLKTMDGGDSWFEITADFSEIRSSKIYIEPDNSEVLYATLSYDLPVENSDIFTSADGGVSWSFLASVAQSQYVSSLAFDSGNHNEIYLASYPYGVFYSSDHGQDWNYKSTGITQSEVWYFAVGNSQILYASVSNRGTYRTTDCGISWININKNLSTTPGRIIASHTVPNLIFCNDYLDGVLFCVSTNGGDTWQNHSCSYNGFTEFCVGPDNQTVFADAFLGDNNGLIITGLIKSTNCGDDWSVVDTEIDDLNYIDKIEIDPVDKNIVYVNIAIRGVESKNSLIRTFDGGLSWEFIADSCDRFFLNYQDSRYIYYYHGNDFFISDDRGSTFTNVVLDFEIEDIASDLKTTGVLYALAVNDGIKRSSDYGFTWHIIEALQADCGISNIELCYNDQNVPVLFSSTGYNGILKYEFDNQTGIIDNSQVTVDDYVLFQNHPNPFNPATKISFSLPSESHVTMKIYDVLGREVSSLLNNELKPAGNYSMQFNGYDLPSGIYFYRLQTDNFISTKKMMLIK